MSFTHGLVPSDRIVCCSPATVSTFPTDGAAGDHESEALEDAIDALFVAGSRAPTHR